MSINFNKSKLQEAYESILGGETEKRKNDYKNKFENHLLSNEDIERLKIPSYSDANDYFYNACICMFEAIDGVCDRRYSWATVKLYYSIFYALRSSLLCKGYALVRYGKYIYRLKLQEGEEPLYNKKKCANSHMATLYHYKEVFMESDVLGDNTIDDKDAYGWMEDVRNIVNYKSVNFMEPDHLEVWDEVDEALYNDSLLKLIENICNDDTYLYCFQPEYAVIAIPLVRILKTSDDIKSNNEISSFSWKQNRIKYLNGIVAKREELKYLKSILFSDTVF